MRSMRDERIDVMRGIAIILVVLQHSVGSSNLIGKFILSFHMPLFFIISGYLAKPFGGGYDGFYKTVVRKANSLLLPQLFLAIITWLYNFLISYLLLQKPNEMEFSLLHCFSKWWFLLVMFQVSLLWDILRRTIPSGCERWAICGLAMVCLLFLLFIPSGTEGILFCAITPVAFLFYIMGYTFRRLNFRKYDISWWTIPGIVAVMLLISNQNDAIFMYSNTYGNKFLFLLTSVIGTVLIYAISKYFQNNRFLIWCGINSIYIYVLHLKIRVAVNNVVVHFYMVPNIIQCVIIFIVTCIITVCCCFVCKKYFWFMFGDKPFRKANQSCQ